MDDAVLAYIEGMPPENRALFDRLDGLVRRAHPDVSMTLSYKMPTYVHGDARLYVGSWKHGLSVYGWGSGRDGGFVAAHPELANDKGTLRLTHTAMKTIGDDELLALVTSALA